LGGLGFGAYCAANVFMDTYINRLNRCSGTRWISVNWDGWQLEEQQGQDTPLGSVITQLAMTPEQGVKVFERVLAYEGIKQVVQCTGDLQTRIQQWVELESLKKQVKDEGVPETAVPASQPLYQPRPHLSNPYVPPGNPLEQELAGIWKQLLGYDRVGTQDNFFELNGDSLKAVIAISKIHKQLNIKIPLKDFFSDPSIEGLARYLEQTKASMYLSIEPVDKREYYRLSSAQKRMFLLNRLDRESTAYNISQVMELEGPLNRETFRETFRQLIRLHESLRTSFRVVDDGPVQCVHDTVEFEIEYQQVEEVEQKTDDRRQKTEDRPATHLSSVIRHLSSEFIRPFDLAQAPLLRVGLVELEEEKHLLIVDMHHIISDGTSITIFIKDFVALYKGEYHHPLRIQYKDYALHQWKESQNKNTFLKAQEEYWLKRFNRDVPVLHLTVDYPGESPRDSRGDKIIFIIDPQLTANVRKLALDAGVTLNMILLAAYNILLCKYSGQEDIVVGSPVTGRPHIDLQHIFGMFVNILPIRNRPQRNKPFAEFLKEVKENSINAYENQDYQFDELVNRLGLQGKLKRNPLLGTVFTFQNTDMPDLDIPGVLIPGLKLKIHDFEPGTTKFDLYLDALERDNTIRMWFTYSTALFKKTTPGNMSKHFVEILEQVTENINIPIKDISISHGLLAGKSGIHKETAGDFVL
jgi:acyl carrier protein/NRPS condensation-like uncharacterized protein